MNQNYKSLQWRHNKLNSRLTNLFRTIEKNQSAKCNCVEMSNQIQQHSETLSKIVNCLKESSLSAEFEDVDVSQSSVEYSDSGEDYEEPSRTRRSVSLPALKRNSSVAQLELNNKGDQIDNYRSARLRRDEGRGKKRTKKKKRRPKRSRGRLGICLTNCLTFIKSKILIYFRSFFGFRSFYCDVFGCCAWTTCDRLR